VGDPARQASDRFHFLRLPQALFAVVQRLLRLDPLGHFAQ
jgi:hypothetical protein